MVTDVYFRLWDIPDIPIDTSSNVLQGSKHSRSQSYITSTLGESHRCSLRHLHRVRSTSRTSATYFRFGSLQAENRQGLLAFVATITQDYETVSACLFCQANHCRTTLLHELVYAKVKEPVGGERKQCLLIKSKGVLARQLFQP